MYCHLQVSSGHKETLAFKWAFEKFATSCGVSVRAYRADNGRFGEQAFRDDGLAAQGVCADHEGAAEEEGWPQGPGLTRAARRTFTIFWEIACGSSPEEKSSIDCITV